jgi:hypothetical protein
MGSPPHLTAKDERGEAVKLSMHQTSEHQIYSAGELSQGAGEAQREVVVSSSDTPLSARSLWGATVGSVGSMGSMGSTGSMGSIGAGRSGGSSVTSRAISASSGEGRRGGEVGGGGRGEKRESREVVLVPKAIIIRAVSPPPAWAQAEPKAVSKLKLTGAKSSGEAILGGRIKSPSSAKGAAHRWAARVRSPSMNSNSGSPTTSSSMDDGVLSIRSASTGSKLPAGAAGGGAEEGGDRMGMSSSSSSSSASVGESGEGGGNKGGSLRSEAERLSQLLREFEMTTVFDLNA